jgi:hypothetical protein
VKTTVSVEREDDFVLLLVTRTNENTGNSHSEGIRIPYDSVEVAHQILGEILASSADETEKCPACGSPRVLVSGTACAECGHVEPEVTRD